MIIMWDKKFKCNVEIGKGTWAMPEFINGVSVQCKNCYWFGESNHCGVLQSEKMNPESWCATESPKQFFKKKKN